jgi:hypothetical protein
MVHVLCHDNGLIQKDASFRNLERFVFGSQNIFSATDKPIDGIFQRAPIESEIACHRNFYARGRDGSDVGVHMPRTRGWAFAPSVGALQFLDPHC